MLRRFTILAGVALLPISIATAQTATHPPMASTAPAAHAAAPTTPSLLDAAQFDPARLVPAPPPRGSVIEAAEMAAVRALIASATPERLQQARDDDANEDPSIWNAIVGRDLHSLPATWALLSTVADEADRIVDAGKLHFARVRPYGVDPSLPHCGRGNASSPPRSYPSGHAGLGWSTGSALALLMPDRAPAILARAQDYALSRQICGTHFASDTEASHVIGALVATRLLADPRLADRVAAARAELSSQ